MKRLSALVSLALLGGLTACTTVGPDYRVPDNALVRAPSANGAFIGGNGAGVSLDPVPAGWWRLYRDPVLDQLVSQALEANTSIRIASANLRRAMAVVTEVDAERGPHAGVTLAAKRARESGETFLLEEKLPVLNEGDAGIQIAYQIDLFGKLARAEESAHASAEASEAAFDLARVSVAAETVRSYVQMCSAGHELAAAQHVLDLQNRSVDVARRLADAGRGRITDVLRARSQADTLRATLPRFQAEKDAARYRLAVMVGKPPQQLQDTRIDCQTEPRIQQSIPVGDGAALLKRRPDVREAERQLAAATARIGVATAALYPSIIIGASAGYSGILEHLGEGRTERFGLGPLISWTIPDSGARARVKIAKTDAEAALARFDGVVLNALRETETALSFYSRNLQRHADLQAARDEAREAAEQNRRLYQAGRVPYLSSLDAERTLANTEASLASAESQLAVDQVNLFLALGGGWESEAKQ
ncbi:efflux transporter outer membrane subunit [Pseudogulbenkiania subflava]|uniref:Efflux transporter, outer membrane factor (OMF) lipoprotein, NodT family n=1 Tax=Pseudogulbenkiania subflava DSM 22618 TaxID=1123014 RepID=A0A1Y6C772_9NEIS|nr:efflux transporter outer membrane subunit [Pseudogulbenkiania subflava]SMF48747.1 efflux transporter, outer membrane factor (OMF) lipoprotein, NodT family [Pseudogulbenkiania subflava DSM 22618]